MPDLPPIFSICYARQALESILDKKISKDKKLAAWFQSKFPDGYLWHIMDLTEFQYMLSTPKGTSLAEEICHYVNSCGVDQEPFRGDMTVTPSFKSSLVDRYGTLDGFGNKRLHNFNPRLKNIFIEAKNDVGFFFFKPFFLRWYRRAFFWFRERVRSVRICLLKKRDVL